MLAHNYPTFSPSDVLGILNPYEQKNAPAKLYYSGNLDFLKDCGRVSVVGTRKPSPEGIKRTQIITTELVRNGSVIVSGLAEGVDTIAHKTAIKMNGKTIAVLGTSLDNPYPASNKDLFAEIATNHLVISQFDFNSSFQPKNFPIRNRTMALISHATIIIEANESSGTKHQGWEALRLGRQLYILESIASSPDLTWPKEMIKYGAQVLAKDNLREVIEHLPNCSYHNEIGFDF